MADGGIDKHEPRLGDPDRARRFIPGTPIIVFSGYATVPIMRELLRQGRHGDYLGMGVEGDQLLMYLSKEQMAECLERVRFVYTAISDLSDIELSLRSAPGRARC